MKKFAFICLAIGILLLSPKAYSDSISGELAIGGVGNAIVTSTGINFTNGGFTMSGGASGTLSGVYGPGTLSGFTFANPLGTELFSVRSLAGLVTFTIEGPIDEAVVDGALMVSGFGLLHQGSYLPTYGNFNLCLIGSGSQSAMAITSFVTPEPGSLLLFGTGLLFFAMLTLWKRRSSHQARTL